MQVEPQLIPTGLDVTVPAPEPDFVTVACFDVLNVTVTAVSAVIVIEQEVPVPEHPPPDQPAIDDPASGAAVSTMAEL